MDLQEATARLEEMGTAQNRKVYARHGVQDPQYGVSYGNLKTLKKAIRKDHAVTDRPNPATHDRSNPAT